MVVEGNVSLFDDGGSLPTAKALHDFAVEKTTFRLVHNINSRQHISDRLLVTAMKEKKVGAVFLLTDKYKMSTLYASLAYQHQIHNRAAYETTEKDAHVATNRNNKGQRCCFDSETHTCTFTSKPKHIY